jgi:ubiquinone/menaquinone biosynthesis C-methylase UbiE
MNSSGSHLRRFHGDPERLRSARRIALLEPERVVSLSIEGLRASSVLDIGTGTGLFAEAFARWGLEATGVDVNTEYLSMARTLAPAVHFLEGPAEALPFEKRSFDLAFLGHLLHESDDPGAALAEARRVARQRVTVLEWPYREEEEGPPFAHRLSPERIAELAHAAGFGKLDTVPLSRMNLYRFSC